MKRTILRFRAKIKRRFTNWITKFGEQVILIYLSTYDEREKKRMYNLLVMIECVTTYYNLKVK
jgi:hypothetical protein